MRGMDLWMHLEKSKPPYLIIVCKSFDADCAPRRHLLRLWLRNPELAWQTPKQLQNRWNELYDGLTENEQVFPLQPQIRGGAGKT